MKKINKTDEQWQSDLTLEEYQILRKERERSEVSVIRLTGNIAKGLSFALGVTHPYSPLI